VTRSNRSARQAGSAFESQITGALAKHLPHGEFIERRVRTRSGERVVVECKNHSRMELGVWVTEAHFEAINDNAIAGVVVHKRRGTADPLEQYVTMTLGDFIRIAWGVQS
jgi:hypothetical protein